MLGDDKGKREMEENFSIPKPDYESPSFSDALIQNLSIQDSNLEIILECFPQEIFNEILLRLPVKSLSKFKCVSKSWLCLISSPQFIKSHLKINKSRAKARLLMWSIFQGCYYLSDSSLRSVLNDQSTDAVDVDFPTGNHDSYVSFIGECNGLICIGVGEKELFLWNPSIKKSEKFPHLDIGLNENEPEDELGDEHYIVYGFGYDEVNEDYKVVSIVVLLGDVGRPFGEVKVYICSTKIKSWRMIGNFPGGYPWKSNRGIFVNGKLHWGLNKGVSGSVVTIDLATETYGSLEEPNYEKGAGKLGIFEGCLCLLVCKNHHTLAEVWVMKEYSVQESWTKVLAIACNPMWKFMATPLCESVKGEFLMVLGRGLGLYNPNDNSFKHLKHFVGMIYTAGIYIESLVWPCANDEQLQEEVQSY